jgi:hypothetical protein
MFPPLHFSQNILGLVLIECKLGIGPDRVESKTVLGCGINLFTRVGTYVQRWSKFCFVVLVVLLVGESLIKLASLAV